MSVLKSYSYLNLLFAPMISVQLFFSKRETVRTPSSLGKTLKWSSFLNIGVPESHRALP